MPLLAGFFSKDQQAFCFCHFPDAHLKGGSTKQKVKVFPDEVGRSGGAHIEGWRGRGLFRRSLS